MFLTLILALVGCTRELGIEVCQYEGCSGGDTCVVERVYDDRGRREDDVSTCMATPDPCAEFLFTAEGSCYISSELYDSSGNPHPLRSEAAQLCYDALLTLCQAPTDNPSDVPYEIRGINCVYTNWEGPIVDAPRMICPNNYSPTP